LKEPQASTQQVESDKPTLEDVIFETIQRGTLLSAIPESFRLTKEEIRLCKILIRQHFAKLHLSAEQERLVAAEFKIAESPEIKEVIMNNYAVKRLAELLEDIKAIDNENINSRLSHNRPLSNARPLNRQANAAPAQLCTNCVEISMQNIREKTFEEGAVGEVPTTSLRTIGVTIVCSVLMASVLLKFSKLYTHISEKVFNQVSSWLTPVFVN